MFCHNVQININWWPVLGLTPVLAKQARRAKDWGLNAVPWVRCASSDCLFCFLSNLQRGILMGPQSAPVFSWYPDTRILNQADRFSSRLEELHTTSPSARWPTHPTVHSEVRRLSNLDFYRNNLKKKHAMMNKDILVWQRSSILNTKLKIMYYFYKWYLQNSFSFTCIARFKATYSCYF